MLLRETGLQDQYSPIAGNAELTEEIANFVNRRYNNNNSSNSTTTYEKLKPEQICVTLGGTEALNACTLGLINPGDIVLLFEPFFPWYVPCILMAGGIPKFIKLNKKYNFSLDNKETINELNDIFNVEKHGKIPKMIFYNTPHNPTGHVATYNELKILTNICNKYNVICLSDEVYEGVIFNNNKHLRMVDMEGMKNKTITVCSAGKLFSLTGWRVGWCYTYNSTLLDAVKLTHGYITYCAPTPLQYGVANALKLNGNKEYFDKLSKDFSTNANILYDSLSKLNVNGKHLNVIKPDGGYFLVADTSSINMNDWEFTKWLIDNKNILCVPMSLFCNQKENVKNNIDLKKTDCTLVRFAICKSIELVNKASESLLSI